MTSRLRPLGRERAGIFARATRDFLAARYWYPPLHRSEFWVIQAMVAAVALLHAAAEATGAFGTLGDAYVFPVALLLIPLLYAAAAFGIQGSLLTAIWSALVMVPDLIFESGPSARLGDIWQLGVILLLGGFVGLRVDREFRARSDAERREKERIASEQRYRSLFDSAPTPIVITDAQGIVQEANPSASALVGKSADELAGRSLASVIGDEMAGMVLSHEEPRAVYVESEGLGNVWLLPAGIPYRGVDGRPWIQAILRDVTTLEERQRGIEEYARRILGAREEERRRIARELHDGPLQEVIMLSRRLSSIDPPASPEGRRDLGEVHALALSVAAELRRTSRNLRPAILDDLGLVAALRAEGDLVAGPHPIRVQFKLAGSPRGLSAAIQLMLLRVTQEALRNIVRHAAASNVLIELSYRPASVKLSIADDGRGPGPQRPAEDLLAAGKLGIVGMMERASLLGAWCRIGAKRHGGTIVQVLVPGDTGRGRPAARTPQVKSNHACAPTAGTRATSDERRDRRPTRARRGVDQTPADGRPRRAGVGPAAAGTVHAGLL